MSDERAIAWMVNGFDAGDQLLSLRIVLLDVLDQLVLPVGRPRDEDGTGIPDRFPNRLKVGVVFCGISAADGIGFVMEVPCRVFRMQNKFLHVRRVEMEDARLAMIDPDDGMMMH